MTSTPGRRGAVGTVAVFQRRGVRCNIDRQALDRITLAIIQAAIEVHKILGPGLLESLYRECLVFELRERGLKVVAEYLRLTEKRVGLLLNFNVSYLTQGVRRIVNNF